MPSIAAIIPAFNEEKTIGDVVRIFLAAKDIDEVIAATELAGISKPVARFTPIGNVKG